MGGVSSSLAKAYHGLGFVGAFILLGATVYALLSHIAGKATQPPPKKEEEVRRLDLRPGRTGRHSTSDARADPASLSLPLAGPLLSDSACRCPLLLPSSFVVARRRKLGDSTRRRARFGPFPRRRALSFSSPAPTQYTSGLITHSMSYPPSSCFPPLSMNLSSSRSLKRRSARLSSRSSVHSRAAPEQRATRLYNCTSERTRHAVPRESGAAPPAPRGSRSSSPRGRPGSARLATSAQHASPLARSSAGCPAHRCTALVALGRPHRRPLDPHPPPLGSPPRSRRTLDRRCAQHRLIGRRLGRRHDRRGHPQRRHRRESSRPP